MVACLLSLPAPPTPLRRILPVLVWRERWHPLICTALLALFSNNSGLKTAMLCPLSPIYRYMLNNIIFRPFFVIYGCVYNRRRPILGGAVPVPGWSVPDVRILQVIPLGTLPSLQRSLALPGTFEALERLCTDWCDSNLLESYLSTLPYFIRLAMFVGFSFLQNVYWTAYDCARRAKALRMRDQSLRSRVHHLALN